MNERPQQATIVLLLQIGTFRLAADDLIGDVQVLTTFPRLHLPLWSKDVTLNVWCKSNKGRKSHFPHWVHRTDLSLMRFFFQCALIMQCA